MMAPAASDADVRDLASGIHSESILSLRQCAGMAFARRVRVSVHPRASQRRLEDIDGVLHVWLTSAPVEGMANRELIALLADRYGVARSRVRIVSGRASRRKLLEILG
jgi:uncharacterized protein